MKSVALVVFFALALVALPAEATPAGFTTFFNSESCPEGWYPLPTAQGRLIASVADAADAGVTVNTPLSDQEDRSHVHSYSTVFPLPQKQVAAIDCCNNQGACNDNYPVNGNSHNGTSGLPFVQVLLCTLKADDANPVPFGTIAYFEPSVSSCPAGFAPLAEARGRFLLAGYSETGIIASESVPLESGEDRVHNHTYSTSITTTDVSYVGVDGCCNGNPSAQGTYPISGTTEAESTGLPYIQLLTCVSQNATFASAMPPDALLFNEVGCPPGWNVSLESAGRFMVALPEDGVPGATFGGNSLKPGFSGDVAHSHGFSGTVTTRSCGVGLASGCCGDGYSANSAYPYQGTTDSQAADLPYLSVPLCYQHGQEAALW